jgi:hypothetical protein
VNPFSGSGNQIQFADSEIEAAWSAEIARRVKEFDDGIVVGIPADKVYRAAREALRQTRSEITTETQRAQRAE